VEPPPAGAADRHTLDGVISLALARKLRDCGLRWDPTPGDQFVVADRDMDDEVFTLSDMAVDMHDCPGGRVIGFNGTVEWALDSVEAGDSVWLPSEGQLRERLGSTFRRLERDGHGWRVVLEVAGHAEVTHDTDAAEAYGLALLHLLAGDWAGEVPNVGTPPMTCGQVREGSPG
jgi:hypothetical protein